MPSWETIRARELRAAMSGTERRVWYRLRKRRLLGFKFRRQVSVGPYFVDFLCLQRRVAVEIDGGGHEDAERDECKTRFLESQGFRVLSIPASETDHALDDVIETILAALESGDAIVPTPTLPRRGRGNN